FSTFSSDEAWEVWEKSKKESEIMILGMLHLQELEELIRKGISFYVFDFERLVKAISISKEIGIPAKLHIEIETGFHRTGFDWTQREKLAEMLSENIDFI